MRISDSAGIKGAAHLESDLQVRYFASEERRDRRRYWR